MSYKETRVVEEFQAVDDDGETYDVVVSQEFFESRSMANPTVKWIPGLKEMRLVDGTFVNFIDENTFKIVTNDQIIRRI